MACNKQSLDSVKYHMTRSLDFVITWITTHLSTPDGRKAELA